MCVFPLAGEAVPLDYASIKLLVPVEWVRLLSLFLFFSYFFFSLIFFFKLFIWPFFTPLWNLFYFIHLVE